MMLMKEMSKASSYVVREVNLGAVHNQEVPLDEISSLYNPNHEASKVESSISSCSQFKNNRDIIVSEGHK